MEKLRIAQITDIISNKNKDFGDLYDYKNLVMKELLRLITIENDDIYNKKVEILLVLLLKRTDLSHDIPKFFKSNKLQANFEESNIIIARKIISKYVEMLHNAFIVELQFAINTIITEKMMINAERIYSRMPYLGYFDLLIELGVTTREFKIKNKIFESFDLKNITRNKTKTASVE